MWRSELYATEVHEKLVTPNYVLPVHAAPIAGEALLSWLCRLAAMTGQSPLTFARQAFGIDSVRQPEWWRRPSADQRSVLLAISGLPPDRFDDMTLECWSTARNDENDRRFSPVRMIYPKLRARAARTLFACGACLAEDEIPYLRREWLIGWQAVCARHRTVLLRHCPHCRCKLSSQWLRDREPVDLHRCKRCGRLLAGANGPPAIDCAIDLQAAMLSAKRRGSGEIPGLGVIQWETFTVIVDLVLRLVWVGAGDHAREKLLAELVNDLSLAPDARFTIDWKGNYGALVLMGWMIADWPVRLRRALELLAAPRVDDLLGQVHDLSEASRMRARTQMRDVLDYQPPQMDWCLWLRGLVDGGADFRRLARTEDECQRKDRFIALALLSEGKSIEETASAVRVSTNMIRRWLEVGMAYGVEAVLEKPLRICDLTPVQIDEIAAWLWATERSSGGPLKWSREHARSEIMARFGLRITTNAAYQLLLNNRLHHQPH